MEFLTFEMRVQIAIGAALDVDPSAVLHEATMHSDYSCIRCIFSGRNGDAITVKVGIDNETNVVKNSWGWDSLPIEWPASLSYNSARNIFADAFPNTSWSTVVFRKSRQEPYLGAEFVFTVPDGYVIVDIPTRKAYKVLR